MNNTLYVYKFTLKKIKNVIIKYKQLNWLTYENLFTISLNILKNVCVCFLVNLNFTEMFLYLHTFFIWIMM